MKFVIFLLLSSCTQFVKFTDDDYLDEISSNKDKIQIFFSHNINGETHPCGCRKFPLGGLSQINGLIKSKQCEYSTLYLDTGDTFFESTTVPSFLKQSSRFKAKKIAEALDLLGLKFMTPGDQDFALGESFLVEISKEFSFDFLISNASEKLKLPVKKMIQIKKDQKSLFFIGVLDPTLLKGSISSLFYSPSQAIKEQLTAINKIEPTPRLRTIILLSHSGLDTDQKLAKKFPKLDWIIGAHSQSYLRYTQDIGETKLAQVLSRNHYLGQIILPWDKSKKYEYKVLEARDETQKLINPNPMISWLQKFKTNYDKIQQEEQKSISLTYSPTDKTIPTYVSCSDCHSKQVEFWQGTSHSLAYLTLVHEKANNNRACVKCHSVGFEQEGGFKSVRHIVRKDEKPVDLEAYLKELKNNLKVNHPIREQTSKQRALWAKKWLARDVKKGITANHANVQCLNCHNQDMEHPFDSGEVSKVNYKNKCLSCHTRDQSPSWYDKDSKGLASSLNSKYFLQKLKEVSCPKIEK